MTNTPAPASRGNPRAKRVQPWIAALGLMTKALKLLDDGGAPADVGAHLDMAMQRLNEEIAKAQPSDQR